ncbi:MAG TPA: class I SAM-dependent methyltransferase [Patescibacteria group bacterium]|nr:class I SAM-dependent methyltransferase [Patescibacteria group bacterium]
MKDWRQATTDTYDKSAKELAEYFRGIGPRVKYIDFAFQAAGNPAKARVVEIGCGDGRDAKEIIKRSSWYLGFDISRELIKLARQHVPEAKFEVADAATFNYPKDLDVVFAFASLLHLDNKELQTVLQKVLGALKPGGVFYISLKYQSEYTKEVKKDRFGERLFYFYNEGLIQELAGSGYETVKAWRETIGHTEWFELALRKV